MAVYLRPSTTNSSFNSGDYNYQDSKMSIKSAEAAYAKIDDHNLDNTTLSNSVATNTSALSTLNSSVTTTSSSTNMTLIELQGKTEHVSPMTDDCIIGKDCASALTSGVGNCIHGYDSGKYITSGSNNTIMGTSSMNSVGNTPTSANAVAIGYTASPLLNNGTCVGSLSHCSSNGTSIGYRAGNGCWSQSSNNTCIGNGAGDGLITSQTNKIYLGDSNVDNLYCNVTSITSLSDKRDKIDISDIDAHFDPMDYMNNLKPKLYKMNGRMRYRDPETNSVIQNDGSKADSNYSIGMVAQDVKEYEDTLCLDNPLVYNEMNEDTLALSYSNLIPILVGALKQANEMIEYLEVRIEQLEDNY